MLVGKIIGKTSKENYQLEVTGIIRKMDFVAARDPERHWILGRIDDIIQDKDLTLASVSVLGFADKNDAVKMPRMPFKPGSYVYKADDGLIKKVLGMKGSGMYIGLLDGSENLKVYMDPKLLISKHLAVLAKSGFGKSYLVGVILEEFIEKQLPAVIIDPHGEYSTLKRPKNKEEEKKYMPKFEIEPKGYNKEVDIYCLEKNLTENARRLKFRNKLTHQEILDMLPFKLSSTQLSIIYSIVSDSENEEYTLDEIKREVMKAKSQSKWNVIPVLDMLKSTGLFDYSGYMNPAELVKKGKISVINLKGVEPDIQQIVVYKLAKDLFEARKKGRIQPFMFVVEEAHNFCPERGFGEAVSSRILRTIASEGRKFGMGLSVITQRPARIDKSVLSQCTTQAFLRVTNPYDLKSIMDSVEGINKGLEGQIKSLPVGTACIVGVIEQPLLIDIRIKRSEHYGIPAMITDKMKDKEEDSSILYFYPKILEEEVKKYVSAATERFKLVYYPLHRLRCKFMTKNGEKIDSMHVDGLTGELVYLKGDKLIRTDGLSRLLNLDMKEKAVLLFLTSYGISNFQSISSKLKISEKELMDIMSRLKRLNLVEMELLEFKSNIDLNFEEILEHQISESTVSYRYSGEVIPSKIRRDFLDKILDLFNPNEFENKMCYYPYWIMFHSDGNVEIIDAITGQKDDYLKNKNILDNLPL